jgi:lysophospholipase L1-like esterase
MNSKSKRRILCFGDSLTKGYVPFLIDELSKTPSTESEYEIINAGIGGETIGDGVKRIENCLKLKPSVVIIGFGMNDQARDVSSVKFIENYKRIISKIEETKARVLILTINPVVGSYSGQANKKIDFYNQLIKNVAYEEKLQIVEINAFWKREFKKSSIGLYDTCHPNREGYKLYADVIAKYLERDKTIILWQYNGNPAFCNYRCEYCTYDSGKGQKGHHFEGDICLWKKAFKENFGNKKLVFYFGHGEPILGEKWADILELIGNEQNWEMRVISNISISLKEILNSKVAKEKRLNINASFHPTQISKELFLKKLLECRDAGIEVPVVYTLWPPFFNRLEDDIAFFSENNFLVHVRRFKGIFKGINYPDGYTEKERRLIAKYSDKATIKYMLSDEPSGGKLSWTGYDFCIVDNTGNVGLCDDFRTDQYCFGNLFKNSIKMLFCPTPFPYKVVSDGTVDGVANFCELNYSQLTNNHIIDFSSQGNVYRNKKGQIVYGNGKLDFDDPKVRAEYRFPPRNLEDCYYVLKYKERSLLLRFREIVKFIFPSIFFKVTAKAINFLDRFSILRKLKRFIPLKIRYAVAITLWK